jgi:hypothetical protein
VEEEVVVVEVRFRHLAVRPARFRTVDMTISTMVLWVCVPLVSGRALAVARRVSRQIL